jgi:hypothetical protein
VQGSFRVPTSQRSFYPHESRRDGRHFRISLMGIYALRSRILSLVGRFRNACRIVQTSLRSFHGHIAIQSTKGPAFLGLDSVPLKGPEGALHPRPETIARIDSINRLGAIYPWVDTADLRIFLLGFDSAERFYRGSVNNEETIAASLGCSFNSSLSGE